MLMMSPLLESAVTLYGTCFPVGPSLFGLASLSGRVHASIRPLALNQFSIPIAAFSMLTFALKLLTVNAMGSLPNTNAHRMVSVCRLTLSALLSVLLNLWYSNSRDASLS